MRVALPIGWKSYVTSSYPGGWIIPNKVVCTSDLGAYFSCTRVGNRVLTYKKKNYISRYEEHRLSAYCKNVLSNRSGLD